MTTDELEVRSRAIAAAAERLGERLERARRAGASETSLEPLVPWSKAFAAGDAGALVRRLDWDGLEPSVAAGALGPVGERGEDEPLPAWLESAVAIVGLGRDLRGVDGGPDLSDLPFAELWKPWVVAALAALEREARARPIPAASRPRLGRELGEEIARAAALATHRAYLDSRVADPSAGAYRRFVDATLADGLLSLYEPYPVLLRQTWILASGWLAALAELGERIALDRAAIGARFGDGDPDDSARTGEVVEVSRLAADRHDGGRGVFRVTFEGGPTVVYKPRSLAAEAGFRRFVARLAEAGLDHLPPALAVLEREGYGWMAWAGAPELPDRGHAARWFRRAGTLVALAELLGAEDLHAENLVATADGPAIVDGEMLLQPVRTGQRRSESFAAGLLHRAGPASADRESTWAGLHPARERVVSDRGRGWSGLGGDEIAPVAVPVVAPELPNTPRLEGERPGPEEFSDTLLEGYENAGRFLLEHRAELGAAGGPLAELAGASVRLLFRPSQEYAAVLDLLASPRYQRRGESGGLLLEAMLRPFAGHPRRPLVWPLVSAERAALEQLDLPRFEVAADSRTVVAAAGAEPVEGLLARSAIAAARERLAGLTEAELDSRSAEMVAALAPRRPAAAAGGDPGERPTGLAAALALADRVLELELEPARRARRQLPPEERLRDLALYDGRLGRALALLAADRRDGGRRFAALRDELADDVGRFAADLGGAELPVGILNGLGALVWALVALARATRDPDLATLAARCGASLTGERLVADRRLDLEGGAAGALLALLALAELTGRAEPLDRARVAGERLLQACAPQPEGGVAWPTSGGHALAGHAHGAAGIARALAALAEATGEARWGAPVAGALAFERALYVPARGNWPVRLASSRIGEARVTWMTAWCHGAAGIALARALLPEAARDERVREEIETAAATTQAAGTGTHDHLCCGAAGRFAALAVAGRREARADWIEAARVGALVLLDYEPRLPRSPRDPHGSAAGLFRGVGGIAWLGCTLAGPEDPELLDPAALERPAEADRRRAPAPGAPAGAATTGRSE